MPVVDDLLVAIALSQILHAAPTGPAQRVIAAELRRLARAHPGYAGALYRTARKLTTTA